MQNTRDDFNFVYFLACLLGFLSFGMSFRIYGEMNSLGVAALLIVSISPTLNFFHTIAQGEARTIGFGGLMGAIFIGATECLWLKAASLNKLSEFIAVLGFVFAITVLVALWHVVLRHLAQSLETQSAD